jgi:cytochrome P450
MICNSDVELVKEILSNKFGFYPKRKARRPSVVTLVEGLALMEGEEWVRRRRILNPAFSMDKLKVLFTKFYHLIITRIHARLYHCLIEIGRFRFPTEFEN